MANEKHLVYKHTNNINNKIYIEVTTNLISLNERLFIMCNFNPELQSDILFHGWDTNFNHELLFTFDNQMDAFKKQTEYLSDHTSEQVYNTISCNKKFDDRYLSLTTSSVFTADHKQLKYTNKLIPIKTHFITGIITYHFPRMLLPVMIEIQNNINKNNTSYIIIENLLKRFGYKVNEKKKTNHFCDIIESLYHLRNMNMIGFSEDISRSSNGSKIPIVVYEDNWVDTKYLLLNIDDCIYAANCTKDSKPENLLAIYLYVRARMWKNIKDKSKLPEAFFEARETISENIGLDIRTVDKCLHALSSPNNFEKEPLLVKTTISKFKANGDICGTYPNIYFVNKTGVEKEIEEIKKLAKNGPIYNAYNDISGYNTNPYRYL